jgi:hypothetical protein
MGPKMPSELTSPSIAAYSQAEFKSDLGLYRGAVASGNLSKALSLRNQIAYHVMADIESAYGSFEMRLTTQRAGFETGSDSVQLGIAAATTVVGAGDVKDLLAASLTAFEGTRLSVDKNFFAEKTTESLISQMRASRKTKQAQLITNLGARDVTSYPWDAAWIDLIDFYYAGTVPSALVDIASSTGTKAETADANLNSVIAQQSKTAISIRSAYEKLKISVADPAKSTSAIQSLKNILNAAGYKPDENASASDLLTLFRKAMSDADPDADPTGEKLKTLNAAVAAANLN